MIIVIKLRTHKYLNELLYMILYYYYNIIWFIYIISGRNLM